MGSGKHPQLAKKLSRLYSSCINPSVNNNAALAKHLGISRQAISKWVHGSDTSIGDCIPHSQLQEVAEAFGMEPYWFSLELDDFGERLQGKLEPELQRSFVEKISLSALPITGLELIGREGEIEALDQAWSDDVTNCIEITAFGGMGKSSLVNNWLSRLDKLDYSGARRIYAWSFSWQGMTPDVISSGDLFIEQALEWFGDDTPEKGTPWAKANRLATLIREAKTLLILDGLEPLQFPPGPRQGEIEAPAVSLLLRELAANNNGLCVTTSRMPIAEFAAFNDGRTKPLLLDRLSTEAGITLLKSLDIVGDEQDLRSATDFYCGHPLCLSLLAGYLAVVHEGSIANFRELDSLSAISSYNDRAGSIVRAYLSWIDTPVEISLLKLLGLFDRCVSLDELKHFIKTETVSGLTEKLARLSLPEWGYALKKLVDAKLISKSKRGRLTMIDCHPLVRDFLNQHLRSEEAEVWRLGNEMLFRYLESTAISDPRNMLELEPLFRAVIHGTRAGLFEESFQLYFERIKRGQFSIFTEGSHHADQSCIRAFFDRPWIEPVAQLSETASFYLLSCAAANLIYLGQIDEAIGPSIQSIQWFQRNERWTEAAVTSGPLLSMLIAAGRLQDARSEWNRIRESVERADNRVLTAVGAAFEAYICYLEGDQDEARKLFEVSELVLGSTEPGCEIVCPTVSAYYCMFLLDIGRVEKALERALKTMQWRAAKSWQVAVDTTSLYASDLMILGLIYLESGDLNKASYYLETQVDLLKGANEWLYLPNGLIARSKLLLLQGEVAAAREDLEEALTVAKNTGAHYSAWEATVSLAELALHTGELESGRLYLRSAEQIDGIERYHNCTACLDSLRARIDCE